MPDRSWSPPSGPATRLILVRHGSTEHSAERRFSGRNELALDEPGRAQADALARRAPSLGDVDAVLSSPLARTRQTAAAMAAALGLEVEVVDDLVETDFGDWEGLRAAEARDRAPEQFTAWTTSVDVAPPGGESFATVTERVARARDAILASHAQQCVVAVTHVTPIKTLVRLALEAPPVALYRLHLDTASVSIVDYVADGAASVRLFNDTAHLST